MNGIYHVSFPGLGINLEIHNQVQIFGLSIYWYGIIIATGLILAVIYGCVNSKRLGISADNLLNCVIVGVITGILGARLYYVLFNLDYYGAHPDKIFAINEGGLAIYGGIIGALIGGLIVAKICKMNIPALLDVASVGFLIGQGIGRWGNFFNQEAYGVATSLPWGMISEGTNNTVVHPCFLYESVWCLLGAILIHIFSHSKYRRYHGQMALIYLVWYGAERAVVESLRTDSLFIGDTGIRVSQLLSIVLAVAGAALLIFFYVKKLNNLSDYAVAEKTAKGSLHSDDNLSSISEQSTEKTEEKPEEAEEALEDTQFAAEDTNVAAQATENAEETKKEKPEAASTAGAEDNADGAAEDEETVDISSLNDKDIDNILNDIKNMKM